MSVQGTDSRSKGMELFEIKPVAVGGDPVSMENKIWLTRQEHFQVVRFWNRTIEVQRKAALEKAGRNGE
ncbi:hypothetical protein NKH34_15030 [Mesorhizobium sp. M1148]|uniref:hypothetical protein n=1 Tax=unclassified Mesorhizobium TaxID=325217 RepID=UPI0003CF8FB4|nr:MULTISPECIES: hypothetical protein [unclassified Mesorhizobium]ESX85949.1 hypothetical protein X754_29035 [Mesorhizobium sp. LNJC403B00]ESY06862.1 hypothetical protein X753_14510 [Mesorhizobium sp. LNJC399B00]ESY29439.1 hypothetical protein X749_15960 [Mesorhizobium sp. LNJC391B00]ESY40167.1 hypothetical protein X746_27165 [Mesorhizobium sp. LNJC380A00]ESZ24618.1 hypothetical protein X732_33395 [Mesorhizobium sp. L2C066B000]